MVVYKNSKYPYKPPNTKFTEVYEKTPLAEYDFNSVIDVVELETDRIRLEPFLVSLFYSFKPNDSTGKSSNQPSKHFDEVFDVMKTPEGSLMWKYMDVSSSLHHPHMRPEPKVIRQAGPFGQDDRLGLLQWFEKERRDEKKLTYAIIDKASGSIAGNIWYALLYARGFSLSELRSERTVSPLSARRTGPSNSATCSSIPASSAPTSSRTRPTPCSPTPLTCCTTAGLSGGVSPRIPSR